MSLVRRNKYFLHLKATWRKSEQVIVSKWLSLQLNFHNNNTFVLHNKAFSGMLWTLRPYFLQVLTKTIAKFSKIRNYSIQKSPSMFQFFLHLGLVIIATDVNFHKWNVNCMDIDRDVKIWKFPISKNVNKDFNFFNGFHGIILKVLVSLSFFFFDIKVDNRKKGVWCLW